MRSFPPGSCVDEDLNRYAVDEAGCVPELASGLPLGCTD